MTTEGTMTESMKTFLAGVRDTSPILLGVIPFGLICGAYCVSTGMPEWAAINFSLMIFAGASQLVANQLMAENASFVVIVMTGLVINMRMLMYSASLGQHFKGVHPLKKAVFAYMLTDQAYAMSIDRYGKSDGDHISKPAYYFGSSVLLWFCFNTTTAIGAYIGAFIPPEWDLGFAIPSTFTAIVIPAVKDRPAGLAAVSAALVALAASGLPYNLGLMVGAITGIVVGCVAKRRVNHG